MIRPRINDEPVEFAAAGCFCLADESVLIIRRQRLKKYELHWAIPTGKIEPGETARECTVRELREEVGLIVNQEDLTLLSDSIVETDDVKFEYFAFAAKFDRRPALNLNRKELDSAQWIHLSSIRKDPVVPYFYNTVDQLKAWHRTMALQLRLLPEAEVKRGRRKTIGT